MPLLCMMFRGTQNVGQRNNDSILIQSDFCRPIASLQYLLKFSRFMWCCQSLHSQNSYSCPLRGPDCAVAVLEAGSPRKIELKLAIQLHTTCVIATSAFLSDFRFYFCLFCTLNIKWEHNCEYAHKHMDVYMLVCT